MKLKSLLFQSLIGSLLFCFTLSLHAQSTSLVYKVKGKNNYQVKINFSGEAGSIEISPDVFFSQSNIYFTLTADPNTGKGIFKDNDIQNILSNVKILQNEKSISQSGTPRSLLNVNSKVNRIIIAFDKSKIEIFKKFAFSVGGLFSNKLKLDEKYLESFESAKDIYDKGIAAFDANHYRESYKELYSLHINANRNAEIKALSFYESTLKKIDESVENFILNAESDLDKSNQNFVDNGTEEALKEFQEFYQGVQTYLTEFEHYFTSDLKKASVLFARVEVLNAKIEQQFQDNIQLFKKERMALLEQSDYSNYQFSSYIDLIARLIIDADSLWIIDRLQTIGINKTDRFIKEYSDLYEDQKQEFRILIGLINDNIEQGFILSERVIENLEVNVEFQKQPYLEILVALNALEKDKDTFEEYLKLALTKCSDEKLIAGIELWQISFLLTKDQIGSQTLRHINEGAQLIEKKRWKPAEDRFNMLKRQISGFAPIWFYSGKLKYNMGESYSAEVQFKKALSLYAEYIAPRKYILDIFEKEKSYVQLLSNSEEAITTFDTWLFRYYKAKALIYLKKYELAVDELLNFCITKNKWDTNQYFLLGDAYLELNKFEEAKAAYTKTQEIDPFSSDSKRFDDKMRMVYQKEKEYSESKRNPVSDTTSVSK